MNPDLDRLARLLDAAPPIEPHYGIERSDAGGTLDPDRKIAAVESSWRGKFPQTKPGLTATQHDFTGMWNEAGPWLALLEKTPLAWQSFDVLDDLAMAVDVLQILGADTTVLEPLLERGAALIEANLAAADAASATLPWVFLRNRPALRILAHRAYRALEPKDSGAASARFVELAERLIALNPNDNHGMRDPLSRAYLERGVPEKVLALSKRYPDDFCTMTLNRILALYRLDRRGEALQELHDSVPDHAVAIKMLLADNPQAPRASAHGITVGGKDEAWTYRTAHRALWERDGALEWLSAAWRAVRK